MLATRLASLKAAGVDVDLVIVPMHIWRLEFFRQIGIEAQHRGLEARAREDDRALAAAPGAGKMRLLRFRQAASFRRAAGPRPSRRGERRYFLESSHFYPWLGDKVLAKVFEKGELGEDDEPFGTEIGPGSIDADREDSSANPLSTPGRLHIRDDVSYVKGLISKR